MRALVLVALLGLGCSSPVPCNCPPHIPSEPAILQLCDADGDGVLGVADIAAILSNGKDSLAQVCTNLIGGGT